MHCGLHRWVAGAAFVGADVEVGQGAVEEERDMRADRMAIIKHRKAVDRPYPVQFGLQRGVVGQMVGRAPSGHLAGVGFLPVQVDGISVEIGEWTEPGGVLPGIEAGAVGITVDVNNIAMDWHADAGHAVHQPFIELVDMPIGIGKSASGVIQARQAIFGDFRSCMGQAQYKRAVAANDFYWAHGLNSKPAAVVRLSSATQAAAALRSGAR